MIDPKLQAELRAKFNPDGSKLRNYQLYLLQMLKDFDTICNELGVKYWLSSGTLIGAARHGGFIPWDDDIDIEMTKDDYEKLLNSFQETDKYAIQSHENDKYFFQTFAKFRDKKSRLYENQPAQQYYQYNGIFIDILKMNFTNKAISKQLFRLIEFFSLPLKTRKKVPKFITFISKEFINLIFKLIPHIDKFYAKRNNLEFGHDYGSYFYNKKRDYNKLFPLKTAKFEDYSFPVPNDMYGYLSATYGNWMKFPDFDNLHIHLVDVEYF